MRRKAAVGFLIAACVLLTGCKEAPCKAPLLRELDADMPTAIVKQYAASDKPYVDQGCLWLPGFLALRMHVSKTADGYHGTGHFGMGPLGTLVVGKQSSDFNDDGQLLQYTVHACCLWGILLSDDSCKEYVQAEENWSEHWSRKFLFGLLGYEGDSHNWRAFYFLYMPIVTSHGQGHKWRHEREQAIEREHENGREQGQDHEERTPETPERHHT